MYKEISIGNSIRHFDIVQVGAGGNGGYLVQILSKMLYALKEASNIKFRYTIVDGDSVEKKNLKRQPFIEEDLHGLKANVLANRYGGVYDIPIYTSPFYIESYQDINKLFLSYHYKDWDPGTYHTGVIPILIGCVDNHATRKIMHESFMEIDNMIYLDCGIDGINEGDKTSGYSGHVVCGYKKDNEVLLDPVGIVYPDILNDTESILPTEDCADIMINQPQRMQTNELTAVVLAGYLNNIMGNHSLPTHYTNFDARTNVVRSVFIEK